MRKLSQHSEFRWIGDNVLDCSRWFGPWSLKRDLSYLRPAKTQFDEIYALKWELDYSMGHTFIFSYMWDILLWINNKL